MSGRLVKTCQQENRDGLEKVPKIREKQKSNGDNEQAQYNDRQNNGFNVTKMAIAATKSATNVTLTA